ncbi:MAG: HigA family addiction module antidote protein [Gammaproteobacteria bacterium]|nr:HigA family addiction module antidote protein [Gammaproteobacteria bacterium]
MTDMYEPAHPGEIVREAIDAEGWSVTEAAARLGVARVTLQRVVNARAGVSPRLAIALEKLGWSDAGHWVRMQGAYDLARARRDLNDVA